MNSNILKHPTDHTQMQIQMWSWMEGQTRKFYLDLSEGKEGETGGEMWSPCFLVVHL